MSAEVAKFLPYSAAHGYFMVEFRIAADRLDGCSGRDAFRSLAMNTVMFLLSVAVLVVVTVSVHIVAMRVPFEDLPPLPRED
jgi:hypothetical protein